MRLHRLSRREALTAFAIGVANALLLSAVMVPAFRLGIAPMPAPPSLALARLLLGPGVPLPVGLLFHVAYVTAWSMAYVALVRDRPTVWTALGLGLALWVVVLVVFFPLFGWGFLGLGVGPTLIPASLVPHLLFAVILWGLCRVARRRTPPPGAENGS